MSRDFRTVTILMADDDEDDRLLTRDALTESRVLNDFHCVADGIELMKYLRREGLYKDEELYPAPSLILLDLNMPRLDGRGALEQLKSDPRLRSIPVIILTTSKAEEDMMRAYDLGAASYITKPVTFDKLVELMRSLGRYWVEFVELPNRR
ncbi:MAG: response regulator [Pseudomonadota bacterium]|nr:response regulator [Pseudomonadota bacterium]